MARFPFPAKLIFRVKPARLTRSGEELSGTRPTKDRLVTAIPSRRLDRRKLAVLSASVLLALAVGLPIVRHFRKASKLRPLSPYGLQLVDDAGRPLGKPHGPIKIAFDPFTVYRLAPNHATPKATINEHGGRGPTPTSVGDVVAFLGGSACFGQELAGDDEVFTAVLQRINPNRRWMNFGCPGYHSGQELAFYLHRLRALAPAAVVSLSGWNDVFGAIQGPPRRPGTDGVNGTFFEIRDRLCDYAAGGRGRGASVPPPAVTRNEGFERACSNYIDDMLDLSRVAKARGAAFLWVVQPELGAKERRTQLENDTLTAWEVHYRYSPAEFTSRYKELRSRAKAAALRHGVPFLDVNESDEWRSQTAMLFADPVHPNAEGHRVLASILGRAVERLRNQTTSEAAN
jgi:lysophospholipase L1-like esterase